jgi:hypothetical protein
MRPQARSTVTAAGVLLLVLLAFVAFWPAIDAGFLVQDDATYVTGNPEVRNGLSAGGLRWAWTSFHAGNWHPLTWISHQLDAELYGLRPAGHHLTNLLLHAGAAALLFVGLGAMTGRPGSAFLVALVFAVHPLRAESVVWVAERKDVLCALLFAATLLLYLRHARRPSPARLAAVGAGTAAALLAKPMAVSLPLVLLLLDYWPLGRWRPGGLPVRRLLLEKLPLLALAAIAALATLVAQNRSGALAPLDVFTPGVRVASALISYVRYLVLMAWPPAMRPIYPHPGDAVSAGAAAAAAAALLLTTGALVRLRRRCPAALVGWAWYLVALFPVSGVVQAGFMAMADRYTYLPSVGILLAAVWGGDALLGDRRGLRAGAAAAVLAGAACLLPLARDNARKRSDTLSVIAYALENDPARWSTLKSLGQHLFELGDWERAAEFYRQSLEARPDQPDILFNLGIARHRLGDRRGALAAFRRFLELEPRSAAGRYHTAGLLREMGDLGGSLAEIKEARWLAPREAEYARFEQVIAAELAGN